ncbi:MAG: hypothetical protein ACRDWY_03510 [Actinomycetes bacterium]
MLRGHTQPIGSWDDVIAWLIESFDALDVGDVLELGPSDSVVFRGEDGGTEEIVPCAQAQALEEGVVWVRLSTEVMNLPLLSDLSSDGLPFDEWQDGSIFDDCTDGYLVSNDISVLAEACVVWFRDRQGLAYDELGCEHHRARTLHQL